MQYNDITGKVAFVTGASGGMGKATAFYLSKFGVNVVLAARRLNVLQQFAERIRKQYRTDPLAIKVDVRSDDDVRNAVAETIEKFGKIHYVVSFAGNHVGYMTGERRKPIHEQSIEHLKEIAEVDHFGSARVLKYVLPHMINEKFGCMILISSTAAAYGYSEDVDYIPYKKANEGLVLSTALRSVREQWGVRLYTLAPGDVFNPSTWNSYNIQEREEVVKYGIIESKTIAKIVTSIFSGQLIKKYEMKVNVDTGEIINIGRYVPLTNGDVIIADAKTVQYLFKSVGLKYKNFTLKEYEHLT